MILHVQWWYGWDNYSFHYHYRLLFIPRVHCLNWSHDCQTQQRQEKCLLHQENTHPNPAHFNPPPPHVFLLQVPNDGRYIGAYTHYSGTCPACTVSCIYRTIRVLNSDKVPFCWCVATLNPYGTKCHSLHQYALEYSCEQASANRSRESNSATALSWESSLFYTKGLAVTELAFCEDHYL